MVTKKGGRVTSSVVVNLEIGLMAPVVQPDRIIPRRAPRAWACEDATTIFAKVARLPMACMMGSKSVESVAKPLQKMALEYSLVARGGIPTSRVIDL
jgi:hypothetical protein